MRRVLTILFTLGVCAAAVLLAGATTEESDGKRYQVVFDNAFGLVEGGDFRWAA